MNSTRKLFPSIMLIVMMLCMYGGSAQSVSYIGDFDLSNLKTFSGTPLAVGSQESIPEGITFRPDGLKMYISGQGGDEVNQYSLTTPFNINTGVSHDGFYSVAGIYTRAYGVAFSNDGLTMFVTGTSGNEISQFDLTSAYDVTSTVTFNANYNLPSGDPGFITFNGDGTKMYVPEGAGITQYSLSIAFDIGSTVVDEGTYSLSYSPEEMVFTGDGKTMLVVALNDLIHQYDLTSAYFITSGVTDNSITFDMSNENPFPTGLAISSDDAHLFIVSATNGVQRVRQYEMSIPEFMESVANDGSIDGTVTINIYGDTFTNANGTLTQGADYSISNLPSGLNPTISVAAGGQSATLAFSGNASAHQSADGVLGLNIAFENSSFTGNDASSVYNSDGAAHTPDITYSNNKALSYGNAFALNKGAAFDQNYSVASRQPYPRDITFSTDGMVMFTIGADGGPEINQFALTAPYNLGSGVSYQGVRNVSSEESGPTGLTFSPDGMTLFIVGSGGDEVNQYALTTPFSVTSGVSYTGNSSVGSNPEGISFSSNGTKMFVVSAISDAVTQYSLGTAFDVTSGISSDGVFSISAQETNPGGVAFNENGNQMFIIGSTSDAVHQYSLTTPYDVTSGVSYDGISFSVASEDTNPTGLAYSNDGSRFFISGASGYDINQYSLPTDGFKEEVSSDGSVNGFLSINISGDTFTNAGGTLTHGVDFTVTNAPSGLTPALSVNANGHIGTLTFTSNATNHQDANDLAALTFTYANSAFTSNDISDILDIGAATGVGIDFRDNNPAVHYGDGFDITNASFTGKNPFNISGQETQATGIRFSTDGMKFFLVGENTNSIHQYSLTTPFNISEGISYDGSPLDVSAEEGSPYDVAFSTDGTKMFVVGRDDDEVNQYTLTTPFDITGTVSHDGSPFSVAAQDAYPTGIEFNPDGSKMFMLGTVGDRVYAYNLSSSYDITSGVTYEGSYSVLSQEASPGGIRFNQSGTKMLIIGSHGDEVNQFNLGIPYDITSDVTFETNFKVIQEDNGPVSLAFNPSGTTMYMLGLVNDVIFEYEIDKGGFKEAALNAGEVNGDLTITLVDELFTNVGGTLTSGSDYSIANLPVGLVPSLSVAADGASASLTVSGNATNHQEANDVSGLVITLQNSAFAGGNASLVGNSNSYDTEIGVDFRDNNPVVLYGDPFDMSSATYIASPYDVSAQDTYPTGVVFNGDGTRMFIAGGNNTTVYEYSLSVGYDLSSTVAYTGNSLDASGQASTLEDIYVSQDGTRLFVLESSLYDVVQYNLSTPFNLSTATYSGSSFNVAAQDDSSYGMTFNPDGTKMLIAGQNNSRIYQYDLSTAFDLSTASYSGESLSVENEESSPSGLVFSTDGRYLLVVGDSDVKAVRFILNVPFDIASGATLDGTPFDLIDDSPSGLGITPDGSRVFVLTTNVGVIEWYNIDIGGFTEAAANDGTLDGSANIYMLDDTFTNTGGTLAFGSDYGINNLPAGFTPTLSVAADGYSASLTITGSPASHGDADDIASLQFTFMNSAFSNHNANEVGNAINHSSVLGIDYLPYTGNDITSFTFSEIDGVATVNGSAHTVDVEALAGTDISAITPAISISKLATVSPNTGVEQDFTSSVVYAVTAEDGTPQAWNVTITEALADPTNIGLSSNNIDENLAPGSLVGTLSTTDASFSETHMYTSISGAGDDDNGSFTISGNQLLLNGSADFETKNVYNVRIQTDDGNGGLFDKNFTIAINDVNELPTDIMLSSNDIDESNPVGSTVGSFSTTDVDAGQTFTYSLVAGTGDTDNASFSISGDELQSAEVFDFETKTTYFVRIQTNDGNGGTYEEAFTISINDLPASVTSLDLSSQAVSENESSGAVVGTFSTTGEDLSGTFTYTFSAGAGDTDNGTFSISGDQLLTAASFDFETKNSYSVRVMTDDGAGNTLEEMLTISVNDVSEVPTDIDLSAVSIAENNAVNAVIGMLSTTDVDAGETYSYSLVTGSGDTDNASFIISGANLQAGEVFDFETKNSYSIRVQTNDGNGGTFQEAFTISITDENESIVIASPIADQSLNEGFGSLLIDLGPVFSDEDGDALTYSVLSSNESVVTATISGSSLTISEVGFGSASITVTADDGSGVTTSDEFTVTVSEVFSTETDITVFSLSQQTGTATIDATAHTVSIEVASGTDLTSLTPTIEVSVGASISPAGGQNFANGNVTYTVTAEDGVTAQNWVVAVSVEEAVLGLDDEVQIDVYPNPAQDFIKVVSDQPLSISVVDIKGQKVLDQVSGQNASIDVRRFSPGAYLLVIRGEGVNTTRRFIKIN